ncbi:MAG: M48 family metalloprotease [Rikenellaceae bacterium]|nr:M48 family metalloprotease [Rikenellaceae bacterium]MCL2692468.1 M48 family metalloprotease [Rikenellaceae bacterium]
MRKLFLPLMAMVAVAVAVLNSGCNAAMTQGLVSAGNKLLQASAITDAQIEAYVSDFIRQMDAQNTIATGNDPYNVRLQRIAGPINNRDGINIKVYKTPDVNAFAVADGSIRVYSGLMDVMSDEEVLGVIGHEIGHVKLNHTRRAFQDAIIASAVIDAAGAVAGSTSPLSESAFGRLAGALKSSNFSQRQELEADDYAYNFLRAHGLNPWAMALSFEKLQQMERQAGGHPTGGLAQLFSTHPDLDLRIRRMTERAIGDGYPKPAPGGSTRL